MGDGMFAAERRTKILDMMKKEGSVQVDKLAAEMEVSSMTIRRDLEKLQDEGKIERLHGGAVLKQEMAFADKMISNCEEKRRIAESAAVHVKRGDTVFLDSGTTVLEIARLIADLPELLIVTPDLQTAVFLKDTKADVFVCGGNLQKSTGSMLGYFATQMLEQFHFNVGFFGAASIDEQFRVQTPTADKAFLKRMCVKQCEKSYLVADGSKFRKSAMLTINRLNDYDAVITDCTFTEAEYRRLAERGVSVVKV